MEPFNPHSYVRYQAWQEDSMVCSQEFKEFVEFQIELRFKVKYQWVSFRDDGVHNIIQEVEKPPVIQSYLLNSTLLTSSSTSPSIISDMLSGIRISAEIKEEMILYICSFACTMAEADSNVGRITLPMVIEVLLVEVIPYDDDEEEVVEDDDDDLDEIITDIDDDDDLIEVPTAQSAIESLKKVRFNGKDSCVDCRICLEDFSVGVELTCMPCSHLFHGECIIQWLERRNTCPLCRFVMPS